MIYTTDIPHLLPRTQRFTGKDAGCYIAPSARRVATRVNDFGSNPESKTPLTPRQARVGGMTVKSDGQTGARSGPPTAYIRALHNAALSTREGLIRVGKACIRVRGSVRTML